ncbi:MAG: murein transglycosylase [Rhodospirillales bacterium]|nr:murein transglycosylase [Rhodospirillales bacterium]
MAPKAPAPDVPLPAKLVLESVSPATVPGWTDDRHAEALRPFLKSCERLARLPPERALGPDGVAGRVADWLRVCRDAEALSSADDATARKFFESAFAFYRATDNGKPAGLFTGYYEPELRGAWRREGRFRVPLYARPSDLISADLGEFRPDWSGQRIAGRVVGNRFVPYVSRAEIEAGALAGKGLELLWVDDAVDAFFLHVQGSGRVVMDDGREVRLGYAGANGHPYASIGAELIRRGTLAREDVTMQSIRAWLAENPNAAGELMAKNPSYVFFQINSGEGPLGSQGAALTPGRSLAVDPKFIPLGIPLWLDTRDPADGRVPLRRLVVAQDTGGAIRGPVRGDLFWGAGAAAAERAGRMKEEGRYFLLLPKDRTN